MKRGTRWTIGACLAFIGLAGFLAFGVDRIELSLEVPEGFVNPVDAVLYGTLPDELSESSGVAVSRSQPGVLWTHNDSGNRPILYAIDTTGQILSRFEVRGARLRDWEDIALGPCPQSAGDSSQACLYLADTGDNMRRRSMVNVHVVPEPSLSEVNPATAASVEIARTIQIRYDGDHYDVEALAVDTVGTILLVNKGPRVAVKVMRVIPFNMTDQPVIPRTITELDITPMRFLGRMVTGAAISPNGRRLVVRTYIELLFFRFDQNGIPISEGPPCFLGLMEPQGEAVDFLTNETVILTSEALAGRPGTIYGVRCD